MVILYKDRHFSTTIFIACSICVSVSSSLMELDKMTLKLLTLLVFVLANLWQLSSQQECDMNEARKIDSVMAKLLTIGNSGRQFPEAKGKPLKDYCEYVTFDIFNWRASNWKDVYPLWPCVQKSQCLPVLHCTTGPITLSTAYAWTSLQFDVIELRYGFKQKKCNQLKF